MTRLALSLACSLCAAPALFAQGTSISQYGITWTFRDAHLTGQFLNGDYWVVGPVEIIGISPSPAVLSDGRVMNGSMRNPAVSGHQGYDSKMYGTDFDAWYLQSLNAAMPGGQPVSPSNPLSIDVPSSLISGISTEALGSGLANQVRTMAVLTILSEAPPSNSFRPPYVGTDKTPRYQLEDVDFSLLPSLVPPAGAPSLSEVAARFSRPWIEHMPGWLKECFLPRDNMPNYGREIASYVSDAALLLTLDYTREEKEPLVVRLVQLGIDYYAITQEPLGRIGWAADGGHMSGRPFPILLAGLLLGDAGMKGVMAKSGDYAYQNGFYEGHLPPDYLHFGEIDQTFYVSQRDYERTNGINSDLWGPWTPDPRSVATPYATSDVGLADWGIQHAEQPSGDNKTWAAIYRDTAGVSWSGYILASRLLGIRELWNHQALFDYMDRYMDLMEGLPTRTGNAFQAAMWDTYRQQHALPRLSISASTTTEGNDGTTNAVFAPRQSR